MKNNYLIVKNTLDNFWTEVVSNKIFILLLIASSFLYILPILLANTYFVDDLNRTVEGYAWNHDGRYGSSILMSLLSFQSETIYSLFPYSNIAGACILTLSGFIFCYSIGVRNKLQLFLGSLLLTTCPFIIEILLYRFDSLPISLSFLSIVIPFLFYNNKKLFFISSVIGLSFCFSFYQTTTLSFNTILCFFLIKQVWKNEYKDAAIKGLIGVAAFIFAFLGFKIFIKLFKIEMLQDGRGTFIFKDKNLYLILEDRLEAMMQLVGLLVNSSYRFTLYLLIFCATIGLIVYFNKNRKNLFNSNLLVKIIATLLLIMVVLICTAGVNMVVLKPRWVPRGMIGWSFAIYMFYFLIVMNKEFKFKNILLTFGIVPMIYYSFLIVSQLGMYLKNQDEFSDFIIGLVSPKLIAHENVSLATNYRIKLVIKGTIRKTHRNNTINENTMPIITKLAPVYENNDWGWGIIRMNKFNNINSEYIGGAKRNEILKNINEYPIIDKNIYYTLRLKDDVAIIDFDS